MFSLNLKSNTNVILFEDKETARKELSIPIMRRICFQKAFEYH